MTLKMLGRYELLEQLGEGGMGAVWLARLSGTAGFEKLCIVKTVLPSIAKDQEFVSRFLHEGRVLTQLAHGNIAQVLDMNEEAGELFLALEYVAGVDLWRLHEQVRAAGEHLPVAVAVALVHQAAEGLGAAHRKVALDGTALQVVHRDVSPQNIMVSYEGEVKVIDFGIARSEARSRHTAQASVMGKLGYMAPEQARGEGVDHRADQFALAIVLWELLTNEPYVRRGTLTEMVVSMATPSVRPLGSRRADVPGSLEAVVLKALSPLPDDRYASTDDFAQALTGELMKLGVSPTKPQLGEYVRAKCVAAFTAQQTLLTRVSTLRGPPPKPDVPVAELLRATPTGLEATSVSPVQRASPGERAAAVTVAHGPRASAMTVTGPPTDGAAMTVDHGPRASAATVTGGPANGAAVTVTGGAAAAAPEAAPVVAGGEPGEPSRPAASPLTTGELVASVAPRRVPVAALVLGGVIVLILGALLLLGRGDGPPAVAGAVDAGREASPVLPVAPELDAGAVALAPVPEVPGAEAFDAGAAPTPPVERPSDLNGVVRFGGGAYILSNRNRTTWTGCVMTVPGGKRASLGPVRAGGSLEVPGRRFQAAPDAELLTQQVRLDCDQGFGLFPLR